MMNEITLHQAKANATLSEIKRALKAKEPINPIHLEYEGDLYIRESYVIGGGITQFKGWEKIGSTNDKE